MKKILIAERRAVSLKYSVKNVFQASKAVILGEFYRKDF
jgi:stress response protein SCP2